MKTNQMIVASLAGTTLMTAFSELMSKVKGSNYNEAEILGKLLNRITPLSKSQARLAGWLAHYGAGVVFAAMYQLYLKQTNTKANATSGLAYGLLSGLAGVGIWKTTFKAHPNPPGVDLKTYYPQLVLAHVIFGLVTAAAYKTINTKRS
ncbi:hypothetical protein [Mucilaginibacter sp. CSA2-8R]|uniref:hypothetical protein n=1 Tax=Mucilaginibacter sp. CSA2-8R TaxID=3141542 RepID=UPI00315DA2A4